MTDVTTYVDVPKVTGELIVLDSLVIIVYDTGQVVVVISMVDGLGAG